MAGASQINQNFMEQGARLRVVEFLVARMLAKSYIDAGLEDDAVEARHKELLKEMNALSFPSLGAAQSDVWADEIQQALADQLRLVEASYATQRAK